MPQQRAGGEHAMDSLQGDVFWSGNEKPHKCLRTFSHKTGYTNILENLGAQSHYLQVGNMVALTYLLKMGVGYPELKTSPISKRNMGSSSPMYLPSKLNVTAD